MWHLVALSAKYDLPIQIHTGDARLQGSNPMLLLDLIAANPKTKFNPFHGGYLRVGDRLWKGKRKLTPDARP